MANPRDYWLKQQNYNLMRNLSKPTRRKLLTLFISVCVVYTFDDLARRYYSVSDQYDYTLRGWDATFAA